MSAAVCTRTRGVHPPAAVKTKSKIECNLVVKSWVPPAPLGLGPRSPTATFVSQVYADCTRIVRGVWAHGKPIMRPRAGGWERWAGGFGGLYAICAGNYNDLELSRQEYLTRFG